MVLRRVSAVVVTVVLLFTTVFSMSIFANAATFSPRLSAPASTNKYYYNSNYNVFQKYGYGLPNCTAYAYGRAYEILGNEPKLSWNGAEQWYGYNRTNGYYKYGQTPKVGAIACWSYSGGGHVAVVEKIENGTITLSNSEWGGRTFYLTTAKTTDSNPGGNSWWTFQGYIYLLDSADTVSYKPGVYRTEVDTTLNMRSGAGTSYSWVASLPNAVTVNVTKVQSAEGYTWGYTTYNGTTGWIALDYCVYISELPKETTQPTTVAPTTEVPTTVAPTTQPATEVPTTVAPTTQPTTEIPTTVAPTTQPSTTAPAETEDKVKPTIPVLDAEKALGTGDINGDGIISIDDATIVQKYLSDSVILSSEQIKWCDFNFSGEVSIEDVTAMQKYLANY